MRDEFNSLRYIPDSYVPVRAPPMFMQVWGQTRIMRVQ